MIKHVSKASGRVKAIKLDVLIFIKIKEVITFHDLMERVHYRQSGARARIASLHKGALIQPLFARGWLTEMGFRRLAYLTKAKEKDHDPRA